MAYSLPIGAPLEGRPALRRARVLARGGCEVESQFYCHHEILQIRVRHEHGRPDLPESVPLGVDADRGFGSIFMGDRRRAS